MLALLPKLELASIGLEVNLGLGGPFLYIDRRCTRAALRKEEGCMFFFYVRTHKGIYTAPSSGYSIGAARSGIERKKGERQWVGEGTVSDWPIAMYLPSGTSPQPLPLTLIGLTAMRQACKGGA